MAASNDNSELPRLTAEHLRELEVESGISPAMHLAAQLYSERDAARLAKLCKRPKYASFQAIHVPAIVFPYFIPNEGSEPMLWRCKPAVPLRMDHGDSFTESKYLSPTGAGLRLYFTPPLIDSEVLRADVSRPIVITEGEKKSLSLASFGFAAVGISGVTAWSKKVGNKRQLLDDFANLNLVGRVVVIVFDSDALENINVRQEERALSAALAREGALPKVVRLPKAPDGGKWGVDDFLVHPQGGEERLRELIAKAPDFKEVRKPGKSGTWRDLITLDRSGRPERTTANASLILIHDERWAGVFAYNERNGDTVLLAPPPWHDEYAPGVVEKAGGQAQVAPAVEKYPRTLRDVEITFVANWLDREYRLSMGREAMSAAIDVVSHRRRIEPVRDYLNSLKWDGVERCNFWLVDHLEARDTPYTRAVGAKWLISAVARVFKPGCKADHALILESATQGFGKSSALAVLAGDPKWFVDEIGTLGTREAAMQIAEAWLVEIAELAALSRGEVEAIKAFLTRQNDKYRLPYARAIEDHPRRCVFAGSTNDSDYLRDPSGARRFWPVAVRGKANLAGLQAARDQLWAEAVVRFKRGEAWWFTDAEAEIEAVARQQQEARYQTDAWEEVIEEWLQAPGLAVESRCHDGRRWVTVKDVMEGALRIEKGDWKQIDLNRVARALKHLGWTQERFRADGKIVRCYVEPRSAEGGAGRDDSEAVTGVLTDPSRYPSRPFSSSKITPVTGVTGTHTHTPAQAHTRAPASGVGELPSNASHQSQPAAVTERPEKF